MLAGIGPFIGKVFFSDFCLPIQPLKNLKSKTLGVSFVFLDALAIAYTNISLDTITFYHSVPGQESSETIFVMIKISSVKSNSLF